MFDKDEELRSDLYVTPSDRVKKEESVENENNQDTQVFNDNTTTDSIIENLDQIKKEPSIRDSRNEVSLTPEELLKKAKKKRLIWFIVIMTINLALLSYIIYLVVSIFSELVTK